MNDRQLEGVYRNTELAFVYSYDVRVSKTVGARLGLSGGILSTALDFNGLVFGDVLDPETGPEGVTAEELEAISRTAADFGAGVVLYGGNYYGGFSFEHLNRPEERLLQLNNNLFAGRPQRFTVTGGAQFKVKRFSNRRRPSYIIPNFLYTSQAKFQQLNLGAYFGYGPVAIGGWFRYAFENADGFIGAIRFRKDVLQIGISYDVVTSALRTVPGGLGSTLEISMGIDLANSKALQRKRSADRYNDCFGLFR